MSYYIITYDQRIAHRDYTPLYNQLNAWRAAHLQDSVWLADLSGGAAAIRDTLLGHMHKDDTVCVIQLAAPLAEWAVINARPTGLDWLKAR